MKIPVTEISETGISRTCSRAQIEQLKLLVCAVDVLFAKSTLQISQLSHVARILAVKSHSSVVKRLISFSNVTKMLDRSPMHRLKNSAIRGENSGPVTRDS
jgi:hypothetical protein